MTAAALVCGSCGTELPQNSKFCNKCGAAVATATTPAEYKQVTVLFADVVHSMDIAAAVGAERLREIMAELVERCAGVVKRYGGTVDKFTGDGIMAVFGAPVALEDHALHACLAALDIQREAQQLATEVERRDCVILQLRIGLNSGQVIAGEIGSGAAGYTAIGEQVGMAQRMESAAAPGAVMLSDSTARLVENAAVLSEPGLVQVKGADTPVPARRLIAVGNQKHHRRSESPLVGRTWELNTIAGILDEAMGGAGCVVGLVGPPGIGKSRMVREAAAIAAGRGVPVFTTHCESHTTDVPFHVLARLLRAGMGIEDLDADAARAVVRQRFPDAGREDLFLLEDLLGVRVAGLPEVAPDARRRRLTTLINTAAIASHEAAVYVIEDVHWIDEASESMLADFMAVIPRTPSLTLITYRPEYRGVLARVAGSQSITLRPLSDAQASSLTTNLLGDHASIRELAALVRDRAAGNPFFAEEIVRDLSERGILGGQPGAYELHGDMATVDVPATLQVTVGARVDRLAPKAKQTLNAAAVVGSRFDTVLLNTLIDAPDIEPLIEAELVDQVRFTPHAEYAFRHPLIRTVAYESQLKSDRAQLHRRLAAAIEGSGTADENAALIAEHLEAAGDLTAAFDWHMRAGAYSNLRDIAAAQTSWRRARQVADRMPESDPDRMSMRIAPRTLLCATAYFMAGSAADTGFVELRDLCVAAGDQRSLAIGMAGLVMDHQLNARRCESSQVAAELVEVLESIGDPTLTVGLPFTAMAAKHETGEMVELLRLAQLVIDLADGDPTKGNLIVGSPLTCAVGYRGVARCWLGIAGWKEDLQHSATMASAFDPTMHAAGLMIVYATPVMHGAVLPDADALRQTAEALATAEQSGGVLAVDLARTARGLVLVQQDGSERETGLDLLAKVRQSAAEGRFSYGTLPIVHIYIARQKARLGDVDGAIEVIRSVVEDLLSAGRCIWIALAVSVLVELLVQRREDVDLTDAQAAIDRLAAVPTDPGFVLHELWLLRLRALLAQGLDDKAEYIDYRDRYRDMARTLGFEGHIAWAKAMT